jgi:putative FmdB family regulatory protein
MPIYIYRCESCGVQFEKHQSFTEESLKKCPECNKLSLRKVLTPAGIVFKGSGWYATDHKSSSGGRSLSKSENKESAPSASSDSSSTTTSTSSESSTPASTAPVAPTTPKN